MSLMAVRVRRKRAGAPAVPGARGLVVRAGCCPAGREYVITRWPFAPRPGDEDGRLAGGGHPGPADAHTSATLERAAGTRWPEHADVLCQGRPEQAGAAVRSVARILEGFPGCLVAAVRAGRGSLVVGARDGSRVVAAPVGEGHRPLTESECSGIASFLHAVLVSGHGWDEVGHLDIVTRAVPGGAVAEDRAWVRVRLSRPADARVIESFIA